MNCEKEKPEFKKAVIKESLVLPANGVFASIHSDCISSNGFSGQTGQDLDSNPYITPKKRWVQRSSKEMECTSVVGKDKSTAQASVVSSVGARDQETLPDSPFKSLEEAALWEPVSVDVASPGSVPEETRGDAAAANAEGPRHTSRFLSQPPPAPIAVDDHSGWAKTASRSSYASKVKENLNVAAQVAVATAPPCRLSQQVPMSAVRMVSFPSRHGNSPFPPAGPPCPAERNDSPAAAPPTGPEGSCRRRPLNAQQPAVFSAQRSETLGGIFQNQWGLSFLSEPSAGTLAAAAGGGGEPAAISHVAGEALAASPPEAEACAQAAGAPLPHCVLVPGVGQGGGVGVVLLAPAELTAPHTESASWGRFDLMSAVGYHSAEMEALLKLQKRDPTQVVLYTETQGGASQ